MLTIKFHRSTSVPATVITLRGKTYAVKGQEWYELPYGTKYKDVKFVYPKEIPKNLLLITDSYKISSPEVFYANSSDGKNQYTVTVYKNELGNVTSITCNCPGYTFRKDCKHVNSLSKR